MAARTWAAALEPAAQTDAEGSFRLEGLMPGLPYTLVVSEDETEVLRREVPTLTAGKTQDLGVMPLSPRRP